MDGRVTTAATISFFVGTIALLVVVLVTHEGTPTLADLSGTMVGVDRGLSRDVLRSRLYRSDPAPRGVR